MQVKHAVAAVLMSGSLALAACGANAKAKTTPDNPPLDVPAPPPRNVEPTEVETPQPVPLPQEPARNTPTRRTTPREQTRPEPARPDAAKPEPPPAPAPTPEPPKPAAPATEEAPRAPTTLQTTPAGEENDVERSVRATITKATNDLNRVDYRTLNADARTQYDYAKRFIKQAEDAIRAKKLDFARTVAEKAAVVAAQLAGR
jgi:hypothetical protein